MTTTKHTMFVNGERRTVTVPDDDDRCLGCQARVSVPGNSCSDCHNARVAEYRAARKAQLAAMPRCEGCGKARATLVACGEVGVCKRCLDKARVACRRNLGALAGVASVAGCQMSAAALRQLLAEVRS